MKKYAIALLMTVSVLFPACRQDDIPTPDGDDTKDRTFLIYMAAQNSLGWPGYNYDSQNISSLLKGINQSHLRRNNVLIYRDPYPEATEENPDKKPRLLQLAFNQEGKAVTREIKVYDEQNSASPEVMSAVINDVVKNPAFAAEKYSFLMWSHGTGWLPANPNYTPKSKAIGQDGNDWLNIEDFARAIPDGVFDYIAMDACYMAAAEFVYEMRGKADYLIAAPTEIMGSGMPYQVMPGYLLGKDPDYKGFCDAFYRYYENNYGSTISLIKPDEIGGVADAVKDILKDVSMETIHAIPTASLQYFDRLVVDHDIHPYHLFFDLGSFMNKIATEEQLQRFEQAVAKAVPYYRHSDSFLQGYGGFRINEYCGLSVYVPRSTANLEKVSDYYQTLDWFKAVYP